MLAEDPVPPRNIREAAEMLKVRFQHETWFARIKVEEDDEDSYFDRIIVYTKNKRGTVGVADKFFRFFVVVRKLRWAKKQKRRR